jgi:hypothetical protein
MNARVFLSLVIPFCCALPLHAGGPEHAAASLARLTTDRYFAPFLINTVFNYYENNGSGSQNPFTYNSGHEFPAGSGKEVTFQDGVIWGGFHKGRTVPKVGGSMYRSGLRPGKILVEGTSTTDPVADNPLSSKYRVFRVRPDVRPTMAFDQRLETLLQNEEVALIRRYESVTSRSIYDWYIKDWNEWPAADGAPFDDVNGDHTYDPAVDIPGVRGADQTLWYVANDLDSSQLKTFSGSPSIGVEMQKTIWGYRRPGVMGNAIFISTKLINRSGATVDSMYIGQWADGEVGEAGDDLVGCDTLLHLGYTYNGRATDPVYGASAPAVGFILLSGPTVTGEPTDSAIVGLRFRKGIRSLPLSSFVKMHHSSGGIYADPIVGSGSDREVYCLLRGRSAPTCESFIDPTTGQPSLFVCAGDPVLGRGWVDGEPPVIPGDRRMLLSMGPFTFAAGDTQEIVMAHVAAQGGDRLSSLLLLKDCAQQMIDEFGMLLPVWPSLAVSVRYTSRDTVALSLRLDATRSASNSVTAEIRRSDGTLILEVSLSDDGLHADSMAGDHLFGGAARFPVQRAPISIGIRAGDQTGTVSVFNRLAPRVAVAGTLILHEPRIFSENLYPDGRANPGENLRIGLGLTNQTVFLLSGIRILVPSLATSVLPNVPVLDAGAAWECVYDPENATTYIAIDAPPELEATGLKLPCLVTDELANGWADTLWLPAAPSRYLPVRGWMTHTSGTADGTFSLLVVDRRSVRDHRYLVRAFSPDTAGGPTTISLEDSTDGRLLLDRCELPDSLGHNMPMTDGFKLIRGDIVTSEGRMKDWWEVGLRIWTWLQSDGLRLEGFNGAMGNAFEHWPSGGIGFERQRNVQIRFAGTDTTGRIVNPSSQNISFAHRYLRNADRPPSLPSFSPFITNPGPGFAYQDYTTKVPFAAYDEETGRRLMVGYLENNVPAGSVDGRYWPPPASAPNVDNTDSTGPCEWFFIFDYLYGTVPAPALQVDLSSQWTPLMWFGTPNRRSGLTTTREGDDFHIRTQHMPKAGDIWLFNPVTFLGGADGTIPSVFEVYPNYPNPFNAGTRIKYALPLDARVIVRIYNLLGQQVRLIADGDEREGYRSVQWDGKDDHGVSVGSGVYFCRIQATTTGENPERLTHIGKMVLLR